MDLNEENSLDKTIEALNIFCGLLLISFSQNSNQLSDTITRNFISRGMRCLQSIFVVWKMGNDQDAFILHRSLIDRLFTLHYLHETKSYSSFEDYSFCKVFEGREKLISNQYLHERVSKEVKELHKLEKPKYDALKMSGINWTRPKPKDVAKSMGLNILYDFGYDYASMHVHPISDDGMKDFERIIGKISTDETHDLTVVRNSILVQSLLIQEGLKNSSLRWRAICYKFVEQIREYTGTGNLDYQMTIYTIAKAWPSFTLFEETNLK
ncbi:MAG: DUF5677 domain-containing protein [Anaerolineaceae bacterium]|nr:DUF5677 domain-containing protein [Anaerolineaceae bacterium]